MRSHDTLPRAGGGRHCLLAWLASWYSLLLLPLTLIVVRISSAGARAHTGMGKVPSPLPEDRPVPGLGRKSMHSLVGLPSEVFFRAGIQLHRGSGTFTSIPELTPTWRGFVVAFKFRPLPITCIS